jgi:pimeloyl-ACP methyl ester carboxylesterase
VKLRLYHHHDGARVAYREAGTGAPLALLHSKLLSHREWEPLVEELADRFRLVLPDLPLHGDSEDRPRTRTRRVAREVMAGFCRDVCGPRPLVGGHEVGAQILLRAIVTRQLTPGALVLMPNAMHRRPSASGWSARRRAVRAAARAGAGPRRLARRPRSRSGPRSASG